MLTGWVLLIVVSKGLQPSTTLVQYGLTSQTECMQLAAQVVTGPDRWACFKSSL